MKVVVADTSPLNYLILIGEVDLLARLFGEVLIPDIVARELAESEARSAVIKGASQFPRWISVRPTPLSPEPLEKLDAGEWAAILLAERQTSAVLLLIDDAAGRAEAERRHIATTGTLGIIQAASIRGFTDLPAALGRLRETNFRCAAALFDQLLAEDAQRQLGSRPTRPK